MPYQSSSPTEWLFYDGHCGLCHRTVRFVLRHDPEGMAFRFAPLQGERFRSLVPESERAGLPDSIVVRTSGARLLVRSDAFIYILRRLGGVRRLTGSMLEVIPRTLRDAAYDFIASIRYHLFKRPDDVCPVASPELRSRFEL